MFMMMNIKHVYLKVEKQYIYIKFLYIKVSILIYVFAHA